MTNTVTHARDLQSDIADRSVSSLDQQVEDILSRVSELEERQKSESIKRSEITWRVDKLFKAMGTREHLAESVAEVLSDALREADVKNHQDLACSITPVLVKTIRTGVRDHRDDVVASLYPLAGHITKYYLAHKTRNVVRGLHRRLERNRPMLSLRSAVSGKSVADLSISEQQYLKVEEIFLVLRQTGRLLASWPHDYEKVGGKYPEAVNIATSLKDGIATPGGGNDRKLARVNSGDFTFFARTSSLYVLVIKCSGALPAGIEHMIERELLQSLEQINVRNGYCSESFAGPVIEPHELAPLAPKIEYKVAAIYAMNERSGLSVRPLYVLLIGLMMTLCTGLASWGYATIEHNRVEKTARAAISRMSSLQGYPINLKTGYRGQDIQVSGLVPNKSVAALLNQKLVKALPHTKIVMKVSSLPEHEHASQTRFLASLKSEIMAIETSARRRSVQQALERAGQRIEHVKTEFITIRSRLENKKRLDILAAIEKDVVILSGEVETYHAIVKTGSSNLAALQDLYMPLYGLAQLIGSAAVKMTSLADGFAKPVKRIRPYNGVTDITVTIEYLEAQSQRLMRSAILISQALEKKSL